MQIDEHNSVYRLQHIMQQQIGATADLANTVVLTNRASALKEILIEGILLKNLIYS